MTEFDFNQSQGLFMVGLPDKNLILLQALSEKLGQDIATVMAKSFIFLARQVFTDDELKELNQKMK